MIRRNNVLTNVQIKVLPFSISSLTAFETCPRRHYLVKSKQATEPQTESTVEGNAVHKALEQAVDGTQAMPAKYARYIPIVARVLASPYAREAERNFGVTSSFKPAGYWDKDCWARGKIDLTLTDATSRTAFALDWKTGKPKDDNGQLALTAAALFAEKPWLKRVTTGYVWLAHNKIAPKTYVADDVPAIWQGFLPRVARMVRAAEEQKFPPRPSGLCKNYCPVGKSLCQYHGS